MRKLLVLLVVLGLLYVGAEVAAKEVAESAIAEAAEERDPLATRAEARVSFPLLFGLATRETIDEVEVWTSHFDVGRFIAEQAAARLTGVTVDVGASMRQRRVVVRAIDRLDMWVEVTDDEISKALPEGLRFEFRQDEAVLRGPQGLAVTGRFAVSGRSGLRFEASASPLTARSLSFDLGRLPFVRCLRDIELEPGILRVNCSEDNPERLII